MMAQKIKGLVEVKAALKTVQREIDMAQTKAIKLTANEYKNDVQKLAPFKTRTYTRSIHVQMISKDKAVVGSGLPFAKRLEYGFADTDKLGRVYNQAAQPHFRPAMDDNQSKYKKIYKEALFS